MKLSNLIKFTAVIALLFAYTGCNDMLENVEPSTSVSGEQVLTSADGVEGLRASMYGKIHGSFAYKTEYFVGPSAFTDETRNRPGSTRYQALNQAVQNVGTAHIASWNAHYEVIQDANLMIGAVEPDVLPAATYDRYRGEALALRAFAMHNLVKVFGYDPGNFSQGEIEDPWEEGVIVRTEPVLDVTDADLRPRSSVTEVYNQIITDLTDAKALLSGINSDNRYATEAFVDGMLARVHLYAGNWGDAVTSAQNAITNSGRSLENTEDGVAEMFNENTGGHPEALFKVVVDPSTENGGWNNDGPGTYTSTGFLAQLPTQFLIDKYEAGDYRLGWYRDCVEAQRIALNQPTGCDAVNDNGFSLVKFNGDKGNHVDDLPFMRLAEMYLIWAEAAAKDVDSPAAGVAPLQDLLDARNGGTVPATALTDMTAFEDFILDERMRELALEGHRFYDLKRLQRDIRNPDGSIKMRAENYRILPQLGSGLLNVNELLVENPGY
ncbi:RagB/SusD family nutrient uptake outer membrane protein [Rhodohalobacter halophilus]|uniref:RagB/SusD family nutrient uptake outer membrane protein n=1 Tax=Rhodohalobacter halophilus TaxID=1812810 RepID=UPI00083F5DEE|nr:RagB/SusD family nutrient uptake outer membrane protein [Rhodohalobacter halophilus]